MNCRQVQERLPLYVESDLNTSDATAVGAHLIGCVECGHLLEEYRKSQSWLQDYAPTPEESFVDSVGAGVAGRIAASRVNGSSFRESIRLNRWKIAFAAAMIGLAVAGGWFLARNSANSNSGQKPAQSKGGEHQLPHIGEKEDQHVTAVHPLQGDGNKKQPRPAGNKLANPGRTAVVETELASVNNLPQPSEVVAETPTLEVPEDPQPIAIGAAGLRVEIHTSNPNIRIIWFASSAAQSAAQSSTP
jgi:hypothetical protein